MSSVVGGGRAIIKQKHKLAPEVKAFLGTKESSMTRAEMLKKFWDKAKKAGLQFKDDGRWLEVPDGLSQVISLQGIVETHKGKKGIYMTKVPKIISKFIELA